MPNSDSGSSQELGQGRRSRLLHRLRKAKEDQEVMMEQTPPAAEGQSQTLPKEGRSSKSRSLVTMLSTLRAQRRDDKQQHQRLKIDPPSSRLRQGEEEAVQLNVLEQKIIRQVEYYFGDYNLPKDRFILSVLEENSGWMPMDVMMTFKRLYSICQDPQTILEALSKSPTRLIQVDFENKRIRRSPLLALPSLNEERKLELRDKTVYVGGFDKNVSLDDLIEFFEQGFERVINVHRRVSRRLVSDGKPSADEERDDEEVEEAFLGSVFVTFATKEAAEQFLGLSITFRGKKLVTKYQSKFFTEKVEFNDKFDPNTAARTVWVHGFDRETITQDELADFFSRFEGASLIKKRRLRERAEEEWRFTGSVFVTFDRVKDAEAFMRIENVSFQGDRLKRVPQIKFYQDKGRFSHAIQQMKRNE